jgi:hypothetical protein
VTNYPQIVDNPRVHQVRVGRLKSCALLAALITLAGCGTVQPVKHVQKRTHRSAEVFPQPKPQVVEPVAGAQAATITPSDPVGDPAAHAPPISQVRHELHLEAVSATPNSAGYINPLYYVTCCGRWERTDQGVDATMPVGAPILAPSRVKILDVEPNWYAGQPLIYFELLDGKDAGMVQYVAEEITDLQRPGTYLPQGAVIARFARSGTGIEYGLSTLNGITMAMATTGYEEGQVTPAGAWIRRWLNSLGAKAGSP